MVNIKDIYETPEFYGYFKNGQIIVIPPKSTRYYDTCRRFVQTLADIEKRDIFLYSINANGEIYRVRRIRSMYNRKGGQK